MIGLRFVLIAVFVVCFAEVGLSASEQEVIEFLSDSGNNYALLGALTRDEASGFECELSLKDYQIYSLPLGNYLLIEELPLTELGRKRFKIILVGAEGDVVRSADVEDAESISDVMVLDDGNRIAVEYFVNHGVGTLFLNVHNGGQVSILPNSKAKIFCSRNGEVLGLSGSRKYAARYSPNLTKEGGEVNVLEWNRFYDWDFEPLDLGLEGLIGESGRLVSICSDFFVVSEQTNSGSSLFQAIKFRNKEVIWKMDLGVKGDLTPLERVPGDESTALLSIWGDPIRQLVNLSSGEIYGDFPWISEARMIEDEFVLGICGARKDGVRKKFGYLGKFSKIGELVKFGKIPFRAKRPVVHAFESVVSLQNLEDTYGETWSAVFDFGMESDNGGYDKVVVPVLFRGTWLPIAQTIDFVEFVGSDGLPGSKIQKVIWTRDKYMEEVTW